MKYCLIVILGLFGPNFLFSQISIQINSTGVNCFGGNNGSALAIATGGVDPYLYSWSNGASTSSIDNLSAGTYTITVTDNIGSSAIKTVLIGQPPLFGVTLNGQPQICAVAPDGFVYAIPTGGTPPATFTWSNGVQTQLNNHLTAGTYTVTTTDTKGCSATGTFTINNLDLGLYLLKESTPAICPAANNGTAKALVLSGNAPYEINWENGASGPELTDLAAGEYNVSVSDVNGCSATETIKVDLEHEEPSTVQIQIPQCTNQIYNFGTMPNYNRYKWDLNDSRDSIISGDGTSQVQVKWGTDGPKSLSVIMIDTLSGCTTNNVFKITVFVCSSGITETSLQQIHIYPNPFGDFIYFDRPDFPLSGSMVQVFNLQGQLVSKQKLDVETRQINTSHFPVGMYIIKLSNSTAQKTWKMMKT